VTLVVWFSEHHSVRRQ